MDKMEEVEKIRRFVERFEDVSNDIEAIDAFNEYLAETGKEYWFCPKCHRFHPREWVRCDLPSTAYEESRQITEEEWEQLNALFDPEDYRDDPYHLRMVHTRLSAWLREAERVYQIKKGLRTFDIHNGPDAPGREHVMTDEERLCWLEEIRAFYREKQYRHKAWRNTTPTIREYRPDNVQLKKVIRVKTLQNGNNVKIVEVVEYVRA